MIFDNRSELAFVMGVMAHALATANGRWTGRITAAAILEVPRKLFDRDAISDEVLGHWIADYVEWKRRVCDHPEGEHGKPWFLAEETKPQRCKL